MEERLVKTVEDHTWVEDILTAAQAKAEKVTQDLLALQEKKKFFEKI